MERLTLEAAVVSSLKNRRILVGVTGGIAAYKVCEFVSTLAKLEALPRVLLTTAAEQFVSALTFSTLSRHPAYTDSDFWQSSHHRPLHIELGEWAELIVIAPLGANTLAKLVHGIADNLLTNVVLASTCPVLVAAAMNTDMWEQKAVQHNWHELRHNSRFHCLPPNAGRLACDRVGSGRMVEPPEIFTYASSLLYSQGERDLAGTEILISAGGTQEYLDPVRFLGNPATGKMGLALAQAAAHRGAKVTLVLGASSEQSPQWGIQCIRVTTAAEMETAMLQAQPQAHWIIMNAAVADIRPIHYHPEKIPKASLSNPLEVTQVPDILMLLRERKLPHQRLVGFAAQTGDVIEPALAKLQRKRLDAIVANPIDQVGSGFGSETNQVTLLAHDGKRLDIPKCDKLATAHHVLNFIANL